MKKYLSLLIDYLTAVLNQVYIKNKQTAWNWLVQAIYLSVTDGQIILCYMYIHISILIRYACNKKFPKCSKEVPFIFVSFHSKPQTAIANSRE